MRSVWVDGEVSVPVPDGWEAVAVEAESVISVHRQADAESGFRANQVITLDLLRGVDFGAWQSAAEAVMGGSLDGYLVLDRQETTFGGLVGWYRLATYLNQDAMELSVQQWSSAQAGRVLTFSATCASDDFPELRRVAELAATELVWIPQQ